MKTIMMVATILVVLSLLSSCSKNANNVVDSPVTHDTHEISQPSESSYPLQPPVNTSTGSETAVYPIYFPPPEYIVFSEITNEEDYLDAFLHHTALSAFGAHYYLMIPSLRLIETWEAEDGDNYYLCWSSQFRYLDLAKAIELGEEFDESYGYFDYNTRLIRFKVKDISDWGYNEFMFSKYQCVEILYSPDGETDFSPDKLEGFPGSQERLQRIKEWNQNDYIRDILPADIARDYFALLAVYLEYYNFSLSILPVDSYRIRPSSDISPPAEALVPSLQDQITYCLADLFDEAYAPHFDGLHYAMSQYEETVADNNYTSTFLWTMYHLDNGLDVASDFGIETEGNFPLKATAKIMADGQLDTSTIMIFFDNSFTGPPDYSRPVSDLFPPPPLKPPVDFEVVREYIQKYLQLITAGDKKELARFILIDGGIDDRYVEIAQRVIEYYSQYDTSGAIVERVYYFEDEFEKQYTALVRDGRGEMFRIKANYGDSLVGIDVRMFE